MFDFRTVPVDVAVDAVLAWANLDWPVTRRQAFAVRDRLGWIGDPNDFRGFTTNFGLDDDDGSLSADEHLDLINFQLSTLAPKGTDAECAERSWTAFTAYLAAFTALFGKPKRRTDRQITSAEWILPNGALINLGGADRLIDVGIESPAFVEAGEWAALDEDD